MLIGFTGAQSTGKSTLLSKMVSDPSYRKCTFIKEVTRKVAKRGLTINELGTNETQLFILNEHLYNHHLKGCTVLDRCILDGLIYTEYLYDTGQVDKWVRDYAQNLYKLIVNKLDIIFYTDPVDVPLIDDNTRSSNIEFRDNIIKRYDQLFRIGGSGRLDDTDLNVIKKIVHLRGDVETRYNQIKETFKNYDKTR